MATGFESTSLSSCALAALFFLASLSAPSSAAERPFGDRFVLTYGNLESYCDSGTYSQSEHLAPKTFERCIRRDGRYKIIEQPKVADGSIDAQWGDGQRVFSSHRYLDDRRNWTYSYQTYPVRPEERHEASEQLPRTVLEWLGIPVPVHSQIRELFNRFARRKDSFGDRHHCAVRAR
jgi:hypothetical protein